MHTCCRRFSLAQWSTNQTPRSSACGSPGTLPASNAKTLLWCRWQAAVIGSKSSMFVITMTQLCVRVCRFSVIAYMKCFVGLARDRSMVRQLPTFFAS